MKPVKESVYEGLMKHLVRLVRLGSKVEERVWIRVEYSVWQTSGSLRMKHVILKQIRRPK